jgi:hypothetical protein
MMAEKYAKKNSKGCHERKMKGSHARYQNFLDYGDAEDLHKMLNEIRIS